MGETTAPQITGWPGFTIDTGEHTKAKTNAEAVKAQAEARYFDARTVGQEIDNRTAAALAATAEIALFRENLKERWDGAANGRHRVYHFTGDVDSSSVENAVDVLNRWGRLDKDDPTREWKFVICSGGGNVITGMKLYGTLKAVASRRPLTTVATGLCASMAVILHQAGTKRVVEPGCSYMIHDVSGEIGGTVHNMADTMKWLEKLNTEMHKILAGRSTMSVEEIAEVAKRKDVWYMPEEVLAMGFADEVGYASE